MARIAAAVRKSLSFLILTSLAACGGTAGLSEVVDPGSNILDEVEIPVTSQPIIDGVINDQEWENAEVHSFGDGSEVYLILSGDHLYLAIRAEGGGMIAGNVFLQEGDRIAVMHTSAALGTAYYQEDGDSYRKIKDFEWCCRSKIDDDLSLAAREVFYLEEGWLGVNSFIGVENELEYKISLEGNPDKLAVNFIHADEGGEKQVWPVHLDDGVTLPSAGGFPDLIVFSVEDWVSMEELQ